MSLNEHDLPAKEIVRQMRAPTELSRLSGASATPSYVAPVSSVVVVDGKAKRQWLMGDPWSDDYYFKWSP